LARIADLPCATAHAEALFNEELVRWKAVIDRAGIKLEP
jgi:hypothetical protein